MSERKNYRKDIFFSKGSMVFSGKCRNISTGGALISSRHLHQFGKGTEILVAIPLTQKRGSLKTRAIVRWTKKDLMGIRFYKRKNVRKIYRNPISVSTNSEILSATIINLSKGGAHIVCKQLPSLKKGLKIHVTIPFAKKHNQLTRKAVVKWINDDQFGVEFI